MAIVAALLASVEAYSARNNPYAMMNKGRGARPYMGRHYGLNSYGNYAFGYRMPRYGAYPYYY